MNRRQWERRRAEQAHLARAAERLRRDTAQSQAEHTAGRGPLIPFDRYIVVGLLDALARAAGNNDLPEDVRSVSNELATAILTDTDHSGP